MSASTSLLIISSAQSAAASVAAQEAARKACAALVRGYEHDKATPPEMRAYAECARLLHPSPMTGGEAVALKGAVLFMLVAMIVGVLYEFRAKDISDTWIGHIFGGLFIGFAVGFCLLGLLFLLWAGAIILVA